MITIEKFDYLISKINEIHDIDVNQKYNKNLPYSFHLNNVRKFGEKYIFLIEDGKRQGVLLGCQGHDLIEDARMTWNDVVNFTNEFIADIIYGCTELRGKNRGERHGKEYIDGLKSNKYALFVKLCDIMANSSFSLSTNSSMYKKYQKEFTHFEEECYLEEYDVMFKDLKKILSIY